MEFDRYTYIRTSVPKADVQEQNGHSRNPAYDIEFRLAEQKDSGNFYKVRFQLRGVSAYDAVVSLDEYDMKECRFDHLDRSIILDFPEITFIQNEIERIYGYRKTEGLQQLLDEMGTYMRRKFSISK